MQNITAEGSNQCTDSQAHHFVGHGCLLMQDRAATNALHAPMESGEFVASPLNLDSLASPSATVY